MLSPRGHATCNGQHNRCTVIAQIFVRDLISYNYFIILAESTKFSSMRKPYTYTRVSDTALAARKFLAYENQQTLEYEIFTLTKISAITVNDFCSTSSTRCSYARIFSRSWR